MAKLNHWIFVLYLILLILGLLFIVNSSIVDAFRDFGNRWSYFIRQSLWGLVSLAGYLILSRLNPDTILSKSYIFYWINIVLLVLVLVPGIGMKIYGARRWLNVGFFLIQPSEFVKTTLILFLPYISRLKTLTPRQFLFGGFLPVMLILMEPDLGTALVVSALVLGLYYFSGQSIKNLTLFLPLGMLFIGLYIIISPYRLERLKTYTRSVVNPQKESYQSAQSLIAIGRGGLFGVGFGQSFQKYNFLPESSTDAIFSIIAEESGFVGSSFLLLMYLILISLAFKVSRESKNPLYSHTASGVAVLISAQTLLNMGALTGILPLTGIPLPFISYGGSSLLNFSLSLGLLTSIAKTC